MNKNIENMVKLANKLSVKLATDLAATSNVEGGAKDENDKKVLDELERKMEAVRTRIKKITKDYEYPIQLEWWEYPENLPESKRPMPMMRNLLNQHKKDSFNSNNLRRYLNIENVFTEVLEKGFIHDTGRVW